MRSRCVTLARAAEARGATLVHYGSDFVFDGLDGPTPPYDESVPPSPRSVYAASKLVGEWLALEFPRAYVLRVESLFGAPAGLDGPARIARHASCRVSRRVARCRCSPIASSRRAMWSMWRRPHGTSSRFGAPARSVSLRELGVTAPGTRWRSKRRGCSASRPRLKPITTAECPLRGRAPAILRAVESQARRRRFRDADMAGCAASLAAPRDGHARAASGPARRPIK